MGGNGRDFKANADHWSVIVGFIECYPNMVRGKFQHGDGDNAETKKLWEQLANQLNSLGYGHKSVGKWQLAIGRWKSKVKAKATSLRLEKQRTGGGEVRTPPLTDLEERLMGLMGWRAITGDNNVELGVARPAQCQATTAAFESPPAEVPEAMPSTSSGATTSLMEGPLAKVPKLTFFKANAGGGAASAPTKRKVPQRTEKSKKFVSMHKMHTQQTATMKKIEQNTAQLTEEFKKFNETFETFVKFIMEKNK